MPPFALGLDFGTESARALLVDVQTGDEVAEAVAEYPHGVIAETLLDTGAALPRDWALQDPADWLAVLRRIVPEALKAGRVRGGDVVGVGVDFTACTLLPVAADGTPLSFMDEWRGEPHAWCKLWKHHGAEPYVPAILQAARERGEEFLQYYGGALSSEWLLPKALQVLREAPAVYRAAAHFAEGGDWLVWRLTGRLVRNATAAGYKGMWVAGLGYPGREFLEAVDPSIATLYEEKISGPIVPAGVAAGGVTWEMAEALGLAEGTPVSAATIDAHAGVPGCGVVLPGTMAIVMGTSSCQMALAERPVLFEGFAGLVKDGIVPGYWGYESGQAAVGDIFAWFVNHCAPAEAAREAEAEGVSIHEVLTRRAEGLKPCESGLLALDWWNGNRSVLMNARLSGLLAGATLDTKAHEIYRALIEAAAFGTRKIVESYVCAGVAVDGIVACGGLAERNPLLMRINADVLNRPIAVASSGQTVALGAAMLGAVASGPERGGYASVAEAAAKMVKPPKETYRPDPGNAERYSRLFAEYERLHDLFGRELPTMENLRGMGTI